MPDILGDMRRSRFAGSFIWDRKTLHAVLLDASLYICAMAIYSLLGYASHSFSGLMNSMLLRGLSSAQVSGLLKGTDSDLVAQIMSERSDIIMRMLIGNTAILAAFGIIFLLIFSFFKGMIWELCIKRSTFTAHEYWKYVRINLIWSALWLPIFILEMFAFTTIAASILIVLTICVCLYLTLWLYSGFDLHRGVVQQALGSFRNIGRIHRFIVPFMLVILMINVCAVLLGIASAVPALPYILGPIFAVCLITWSRYYLYMVIEKVRQ